MPDDGTNAVSQFGLLNSPQEPAIDRVDIGRIGVVSLMLVDARAADRSVDNADRDLLALDQSPAEFHSPVTDLRLAGGTASLRVGPQLQSRAAGIARCSAESANPVARHKRVLFAEVSCNGVRLTDDEERVTTDDVLRGVKHGLLVAGL